MDLTEVASFSIVPIKRWSDWVWNETVPFGSFLILIAWFLWADSISWIEEASYYPKKQSFLKLPKFNPKFYIIMILLTGTTVNSTSSEMWSWLPSKISLKWKNMRASLSTHLMKPKPSLIAAITPYKSKRYWLSLEWRNLRGYLSNTGVIKVFGKISIHTESEANRQFS